MPPDVAVIGAGPSGLQCARVLADAGVEVVVLEARARIGGRIHSWHPPGGGDPVELGAQVVHGTASPVHGLVGPGATTPVSRDVTAVIVRDGRVEPMSVLGRRGVAPWVVQDDLTREPGEADVDVQAWLDARGLDSASTSAAAQWLAQQWAGGVAELGARGVAAAQAGDRHGDGEFAVRGGFDRVPGRLAEGLDVRCSTPVRAVRPDAAGAVLTLDGPELRVRATVVTVPPAVVVAGGLRLELPDKHAAAAALPAGDAVCSVVTFDRCAPQDLVVLDLDGGAGFLRCWAGRPYVSVVAKAGAAGSVRRDRGVPAALTTAMAWTRSAQVLDVALADWGRDEWSRGAFTHPRPGAGRAAEVWAAPVADTIFFAGESTRSTLELPWVHAALASGRQAAEQVMQMCPR